MLIINLGRNGGVPAADSVTWATKDSGRQPLQPPLNVRADEDEDGVLGFVINDALAARRHAQTVQWPR